MLLLMGGLVILRAMSVSAPWVFTPILLKHEGSSGLVAAAGVTLFQASGMLGTLGAGWLGDRVGRRKVLLFGAIVGPASLLVFTALDGWIRFPFLGLAGAATVSMHPVCMAMVQETFLRAGDLPTPSTSRRCSSSVRVRPLPSVRSATASVCTQRSW